MINLNSPCQGCRNRKMLCHSSCDLYKRFKSNKEDIEAARQEFLNRKSIAIESVRRAKR